MHIVPKIIIKSCKHCLQNIEGTVSQYANHVRWCNENPKVQKYREDNIKRGKNLGDERFGIYKAFGVTCNTCSVGFDVEEREKLFPRKKQYFCSRKCANAIGGKSKSAKYHTDDVAKYTTVAYRYHERKCLVCGEDKIVAIHHVNENHRDNDPKNLVPLCPTHHQYMHSKHKILIQEKVDKYISDKWGMGLLG
jgi:hypothetical protein